MAEYDRQTLGARAGSAAVVDEGLRSYMLRVYNYMGIGLVVTGVAAYFAAAAAITTNADAAVGQPDLQVGETVRGAGKAVRARRGLAL